MANRYEGVKCPVCNGYLFEDADDIVVCPICGAPHHRACYQSIGHCSLEELHGTDKQYDKVQSKKADTNDTSKENVCPNCKQVITNDMLFCPHCGRMRGETSNHSGMQGPPYLVNRLDPFGGINPATDIGDGVTARQAAEFIKVNTMRYIPKFASKSKTSWNWLAFILPHGFFFYHKMYKHGIIVSLIYLSAIILGLPMEAEVAQLMSSMPMGSSMTDMFSSAIESGLGVSSISMLLYSIGLVILLLLRIFCGLFADGLYKKHVIKSVKKYSTLQPELREEQYVKKGLPSMYLLLFVTVAFYWLPSILNMLFY